MACNTPLRDATADERGRVPDAARALASTVRYCPHCERLYWDGSHVARMRERLAHWQQLHTPRRR